MNAAFDAPTDPDQVSEAERWFRARTPVSDSEWSALTAAEKVRAFRVAGLAQLDLVQSVFDSLADAIRNGTSFADWKDSIAQQITDAWAGSVDKPAWRLAVIFRTAVQQSYSAGRYAQATDPDVLAVRPVWRFDAVTDSRTSPMCSAANGTTLPADHPWWSSHQPPCHFACRSTVLTLSKSQAARFGITDKPTHLEADDGFGAPPSADAFEPAKGDYDPSLWRIFQTKQPAAND